MKIARMVLLAALLLSAFSSAAFGRDEAVAFIQLVSQPNPNLPISVQTREALQQLRPELMAAQRAGQIIRYDVSPHSGVLIVVYRASAGLPDFDGRPVYQQMKAALVSSAAAASQEAATCLAPSFVMFLYEAIFMAGCLTPGAELLGSLRDPTGRVVATYQGIVDAGGGLGWIANFESGGPYEEIVPGHTVTFKEYVGGALKATYKVKAPNIKFTSIDKARSIVRGIGPAGKLATISWFHPKLDAAQGIIQLSKARTISSSGTWQVDLGTIPIRGGDSLSATASPNANFAFIRDMEAPYMYCELGGNYCNLSGFASTPAAIRIVHGGQTYTFTGTFDRWGDFPVELRTAGGAPISLVTYDKVSGTGVAQYALPKLTAGINYTTDTVIGKAPAYKYFMVSLLDIGGIGWRQVYAHSNGAGSYAANFMASEGLDLRAGRPYIIQINFQMPSTGNVTALRQAYGP